MQATLQQLQFNFYGIPLTIESAEIDLFSAGVVKDFRYFQRASSTALEGLQHKDVEASLQIKILKLNEFKIRGFCIGQTRMCEVRQVSFSSRQMIYKFKNQVVAMVLDKRMQAQRVIELHIGNLYFLEEILFFIVMSIVGEEMDLRGFMRIHGAAIADSQGAYILSGTSKSGKSSLSREGIQRSELKIFSDELVVLDIHSKKILPFPIRIGGELLAKEGEALSFFKEKELIEIPLHRVATAQRPTKFYFLQAASTSSVRRGGLMTRSKVCWQLFIGLGIIQMWEYLLRFDNFGRLMRIAWNRLLLLKQIMRLEIYFFSRGPDLQTNIKLLKNHPCP